jgi:hypothetical protein
MTRKKYSRDTYNDKFYESTDSSSEEETVPLTDEQIFRVLEQFLPRLNSQWVDKWVTSNDLFGYIYVEKTCGDYSQYTTDDALIEDLYEWACDLSERLGTDDDSVDRMVYNMAKTQATYVHTPYFVDSVSNNMHGRLSLIALKRRGLWS